MSMVEALWRASVCGRLFLWLAACWRESASAGFCGFWARQFRSSRLRAWGVCALGAPMEATGMSVWNRLIGRLWATSRGWVKALRPEKSLLWRTANAVRSSALFTHSLFGRMLKRLDHGDVALCVFCLYLPIEWLMRQIAPPQAGTLWDHLFLIFCFVLLLLWKINPHIESLKDATPLDGPLLLFIGIGVFLFGVVSPLLPVAIAGWRAVYEYMLWFFVISRMVRTRRAILLCYVLFVLMGSALGLHAIYQFITGAPIPSSWVSVYEVGVRTRAYSIVGSPNILGCLMVMLAPMAAGLAYAVKNIRVKTFCWAAVGIICLGCVFTFSRGAWVGLAVAVFLFSLLRDRRLLLLGALAAFVGLMTPQIVNRISFIFSSAFERNNSTAGRGARWAYGLDLLFGSDPIFGFGLGRFGGAIAMQNQTDKTLRYFYLDNYYLKTLVEMGIVGLCGYIFLLINALFSGLRALFRVRDQGERYSLACGIFAGLSGVLTHCYFENIFEVPYMNAYFWGLCALMLVIGWKKDVAMK